LERAGGPDGGGDCKHPRGLYARGCTSRVHRACAWCAWLVWGPGPDALRVAGEEAREVRAQSSHTAEDNIRELVEWKERAKSAEARMVVLEARWVWSID
jgi:hypothetical protein